MPVPASILSTTSGADCAKRARNASFGTSSGGRYAPVAKSRATAMSGAEHEAAVHREHGAVHEAGTIRGEPHVGVGDVCGRAHASDGRMLDHRLLHRLWHG